MSSRLSAVTVKAETLDEFRYEIPLDKNLPMTLSFSKLAAGAKAEGAFEVLAAAKRLIAAGKDVIELEIGDSPFPASSSAAPSAAAAIAAGQTRYAPSAGLPIFRKAAAEYVNNEYGFDVGPENIVVGPGAKNFQQLCLELFVDPDDGVLVFSPHFPTYEANIARRGARMVTSPLLHSMRFRPNLDDVARFLDEDPSPKAIILNTPHNPTGGVATAEDLQGLAELVRGRDVAVFSDEPYDQMAWEGQHHCIAAIEGMLDQCVAAYTFSKTFSMSGWRLGFAVGSQRNIAALATLTSTALSCVPPFTQTAGAAVLQNDLAERDGRMNEFRVRLEQLVNGLNQIDGVECLMPGGSFYAFPSVHVLCKSLGITSHGLAMYLLQGADDRIGVACLGGECFGAAGAGFLRFSVSEPPDRLSAAVDFISDVVRRTDRVATFMKEHPKFVGGG